MFIVVGVLGLFSPGLYGPLGGIKEKHGVTDFPCFAHNKLPNDNSARDCSGNAADCPPLPAIGNEPGAGCQKKALERKARPEGLRPVIDS
ncbi:MAG: hypothetical protein B6D68_02475 [spirochete symbiont of Stewartia floridana]|nr:MAG: hypothetical protein B6D68_02475 [spirochete symbiont of Stewartia floridana]